MRRFGGGPFLTPHSSERQHARPRTHLDILPHRGGYPVRRLGSAPFTISAPQTAPPGQFISTAYARLVRIHVDHVGLVQLKRKRDY